MVLFQDSIVYVHIDRGKACQSPFRIGQRFQLTSLFPGCVYKLKRRLTVVPSNDMGIYETSLVLGPVIRKGNQPSSYTASNICQD